MKMELFEKKHKGERLKNKIFQLRKKRAQK